MVYNITLDGRNQGNFQDFVVTGGMVVIQGIPSPGTQNGDNPYDIAIESGNPAVSPLAGSIRYATNRLLDQVINTADLFSGSRLDLAFVDTTGETITATVDTTLAAADQLNLFNARSGILADVYEVAEGGITLTRATADSPLTGFISFTGRSFIFGGQAPYNAVITGTVFSKGTGTIEA